MLSMTGFGSAARNMSTVPGALNIHLGLRFDHSKSSVDLVLHSKILTHRVQVLPEDGLGGESTSREWSWGVKGHPQDGPGPLGKYV